MRLTIKIVIFLFSAAGPQTEEPEGLLQRIRAKAVAQLSQLPNYTCHQVVDRWARTARKWLPKLPGSSGIRGGVYRQRGTLQSFGRGANRRGVGHLAEPVKPLDMRPWRVSTHRTQKEQLARGNGQHAKDSEASNASALVVPVFRSVSGY